MVFYEGCSWSLSLGLQTMTGRFVCGIFICFAYEWDKEIFDGIDELFSYQTWLEIHGIIIIIIHPRLRLRGSMRSESFWWGAGHC